MVKFMLDGQEVVSQAQANARLFEVLRYEFQITGVKFGCKEGECGACSVILDGKLVNSCLVALGSY